MNAWKFFSLLLFSFVGCFIKLSAFESSSSGTLIVTYQTNKDGACLDRIRFLVKGENSKQWLYPKGKSYFEDSATRTRKVVIENLPAGQYSVEFLVPNTDGFFAETPIRQVLVASGSVAKLDQLIRTRDSLLEKGFGTLIVSYDT
jgi:hypothetical protein